MRLLMVGHLGGQLATASKMAMAAGAKVTHAPEAAAALDIVRTRGADLIMIDVACDIASFIDQIRSERIATEVVACGIGTDARAAVTAIRAGAKEYVPLPPDAELIAAVIQAVAEDSHQLIFRDPAMGRVIGLVDQIAPSDASILITGRLRKLILAHGHKPEQYVDRPKGGCKFHRVGFKPIPYCRHQYREQGGSVDPKCPAQIPRRIILCRLLRGSCPGV